MASVQEAIDVDVPIRVAYDQWTQFEEFPKFMEGVEAVRQLDDKRLHWRASIAGKTVEWDAEIVNQDPDRRIAWRSTAGPFNAGLVTFQALGTNATHVTLRLDYEPEGVLQQMGDVLGFVQRRVTGDLERFKEFLEARGVATGSWRTRK